MIYYELPIRIFSVGSSLFYTERKFKELAKKIGGDEFNEPKKENTQKKSKKGKTVYNVPEVKKRKKKRSEKLRISLCILFLIGIISVSFPFTKFNVERTLDTKEDVAEYQTQLDNACNNIKKAENNLKKASAEEVEENKKLEKSKIIYPKTLAEDNIIGQKCQTDEILNAIDDAAHIDRTLYTKESYDELLDSIYTATSLLTSSTTISDTGFQLIFGKSLSGSSVDKRTEGTFQRLIYSVWFLVIPIIGFLVASFDKKRHIKNAVATIGSALLLFDLFTFFPLNYIEYGAVVAAVLYVIILFVGIAGFYTKQQEDYWYAHYEECVEKGMTKWLPDGYDEDKRTLEQIQADKEHQALVDSAKNAQKRRSRKK